MLGKVWRAFVVDVGGYLVDFLSIVTLPPLQKINSKFSLALTFNSKAEVDNNETMGLDNSNGRVFGR